MKRNKFSLSHYKLMTGIMGTLMPAACVEVLPGDTFQQVSRALIRFSPLLAPLMHPVHARIHHWFVPTRLIWEDFEQFITGGDDGDNNDEVPYVRFTTPYVQEGELADYFGIPTGVPLGGQTYMEACALPFRAYNLIWNEWYRDQDLQNEIAIGAGSGLDSTTSKLLQNVGWEKDYFTTARPWPQKGPDVTIPLTGEALVRGIGVSAAGTTVGSVNVKDSTANPTTYGNAYQSTSNSFYLEGNGVDGTPEVRALLDDVSMTVADLRTSLALQRFEEARARYGSRYTEYLRYYGVRSSDARLQRPEYLGGGKQTLQISEVLQTAPTTDGDDELGVGNLKGHGIGALRSNRYRRFFEEHGYVLSLISVKPRTMYMNGLNRMWNRRVKEDYYQKEFAHIGQQEVLYKEIYAPQVGDGGPNGVFGYQDRYDEYRRMESQVSGQFRSSLNFWHMARNFGADVALNGAFIKSVPTEVPFAVPSQDVLWMMVQHSIQARRALPQTGTSYTF